MAPPHKLTLDIDGIEVAQSPPTIFERRPTSSGTARILLDVPDEHTDLIWQLAELLSPPYYVLYVLHTPRGIGKPGRYQSVELSWEELSNLLIKYGPYFSSDARHDLWVYSPASSQTLVWDRHNRLFVEGQPLAKFVDTLVGLGFTEGTVKPLGDHYHNYRLEFDCDAAAILEEFDWRRTPLRNEDVQ